MEDKDMVRFKELLLGVCEIYKEEMTKTKVELYSNAFGKFSIEQIKNAFNKHIQISKFFPKPSELLEIINPPEDINLKAENAWIKLREAIRAHGYYDSVQFDDPVIHSVIRSMGGWARVSDREQDNWMHKEFIELYKILSKKEAHPEIIHGMLESLGAKHEMGKIGNFINQQAITKGE